MHPKVSNRFITPSSASASLTQACKVPERFLWKCSPRGLAADAPKSPPCQLLVLFASRAADGLPVTRLVDASDRHKENMMDRDEALKKSDDALNELAKSLNEGLSDKLMNYLTAMSRFHQYSFGNCMLIYMQKPDASHVAGFGRWKDFNRFVKKGEKGIAILAPLVGKRKKTDEQANEISEEPQKVLYGFRVVYVFDISQTEGEPLPEFASLGGDPGEKLNHLKVLYEKHGIALEFVANLPFDANGMSEGGKVSIKESLSKPQQFSTMVHELAHELLHWDANRESLTKTVRETEAESVAYVVCRSIGLDVSTRAADYIKLWNGDAKVLLGSLERIRSVASKILSEIDSVAIQEEEKEVAHVA